MDNRMMGNYKPRRPEMTMEDVEYMTPEERRRREEASQRVRDAKMQPALDAAYEASSTVGKKCGGKVYKKGGSVKGAGIAQRGVKKCKIV